MAILSTLLVHTYTCAMTPSEGAATQAQVAQVKSLLEDKKITLEEEPIGSTSVGVRAELRKSLPEIKMMIEGAITSGYLNKKTVNTQDVNGNTLLHLIFGICYECQYEGTWFTRALLAIRVMGRESSARRSRSAFLGTFNSNQPVLWDLILKLIELGARVGIQNRVNRNATIAYAYGAKSDTYLKSYAPYDYWSLIKEQVLLDAAEDETAIQMVGRHNLSRQLVGDIQKIMFNALEKQSAAGDKDAQKVLFNELFIPENFGMQINKQGKYEFKDKTQYNAQIVKIYPLMKTVFEGDGFINKLNDTYKTFELLRSNATPEAQDTIKQMDDLFTKKKQQQDVITALHDAINKKVFATVQKSFDDAVKIIGSDEAVANFPGLNADTALHYAANVGWDELVTFLLEKKADVTIKNQVGETPLDYAVSGEKKQTTKGDKERYQAVIKRLKDVEPKAPKPALAPESDGAKKLAYAHAMTPSEDAATQAQVDKVKLLLENDAIALEKDEKGFEGKFMKEPARSLSAIQVLIEKANAAGYLNEKTVNTQDLNDNTLFHLIFGVEYELQKFNNGLVASRVLGFQKGSRRNPSDHLENFNLNALVLQGLILKLIGLGARVDIQNKVNPNKQVTARIYSDTYQRSYTPYNYWCLIRDQVLEDAAAVNSSEEANLSRQLVAEIDKIMSDALKKQSMESSASAPALAPDADGAKKLEVALQNLKSALKNLQTRLKAH